MDCFFGRFLYVHHIYVGYTYVRGECYFLQEDMAGHHLLTHGVTEGKAATAAQTFRPLCRFVCIFPLRQIDEVATSEIRHETARFFSF